MLEKLPSVVGRALKRARPGLNALLIHNRAFEDVISHIEVTSPAFADSGTIPTRYTEDGKKISPPLEWRGVPPQAEQVIVVIEDADSPSPKPFVHAIVWGLPGQDDELTEGALPSPAHDGQTRTLGLNSFLRTQYLPMDPPPGHGPHRYAFQVFATDAQLALSSAPGRTQIERALRGHVMAKGYLIGTYTRS